MTKKTQAETTENLGLIPRSILRTFRRFGQQVWPGIENLVVKEFQISRSQFLVSFRSLFFLIAFTISFSYVSKNFVFKPIVEYFWNTQETSIFLNTSQEERAFNQIHNFEEKLYFESLILPPNNDDFLNDAEYFKDKIREKYSELAIEYNNESIDALTNILSDLSLLVGFWVLSILMQSQLIILKSFLTECLYGLGDTTKSFLLLFITDLFVGFHSPHAWEVFLESTMIHFGFAENEDFIFLFVATFPVLLDTLIKYWIFRYLNKLSPSTVATYHTLIE